MTTSTGARRAAWFSSPDPAPDAEAQIFLLPHAGGTSLTYRSWAATLPSGIEVRTLQLPGRQERLAEEPFTALAPLLDRLREAFEAELDGRPYVLFGHSFGALLGYRLAVAMEESGGDGPALLAVSGWAPGLASAGELDALPEMSDRELLARIAEFGLVPEEVTADPALLAAVVPAMRGDFSVARDFRDDGAAVACPVAAYCGASDPILAPGAMSAWAERTSRFLGVTEFPGGHFYLFDHAVAVHSSLDRHLRRLLAASRP